MAGRTSLLGQLPHAHSTGNRSEGAARHRGTRWAYGRAALVLLLHKHTRRSTVSAETWTSSTDSTAIGTSPGPLRTWLGVIVPERIREIYRSNAPTVFPSKQPRPFACLLPCADSDWYRRSAGGFKPLVSGLAYITSRSLITRSKHTN